MKKIRMRKLISLMLSCIVVFAAVFAIVPNEAKAAEEVIFTVSSDKQVLHRGDTFTMTVSMSGNETGEGLVYNLFFDEEKLELVSSAKGDVMSGQFDMLVNYPAGSTNSVRATVLRNAETIPNGTLMTVTFKVKDSALGSPSFNSTVDLLNFDLEDVPYSINNSQQLDIVIPATGISLDKHELTLAKGGTDTLAATIDPADSNENITWSSDNENVVTVDNNGNVTAVSGGTANVTVKAGNYSDTCKITVYVPLNSLTIQTDGTTIVRGEEKQLEVAYDPQDTSETDVAWSSSDPEIVTVDSTGKISGIRQGTADITVTGGSQNTVSDTVTITVEENSLDESLGNTIAFEEMQDALLKGQSVDLKDFWNLDEIVTDNHITDEIAVKWNSDNTDVATVDENGIVYGVKAGTSTITADISATDGNGDIREYIVPIDITVKEIPLESIAFDKVITEMQVGETDTLSIIYNPANTTDLKDVEWSTSDESVVSVENGTLQALKAGTAEITAKVGDKTAACTITVKDTPKADFEGTVEQTGTDNPTGISNSNESNGSVRTGDENNLVSYVLMMLVAAGIAVVLIIRQRSRQR